MNKFKKLMFLNILLLIFIVGCNKNVEEVLVTFDSNGGTNVISQLIEKDTLAIEPTTPTNTGYFFVEWQLDEEKFNFDTKVTEDITLVALWENGFNEDNTVTITFDVDGGTEIDSINIEQYNKLNKPEEPVKEGYTFLYWELNEKEYDFTKDVATHITLKAVWELDTYITDVYGNSYILLSDNTLTLIKGANVSSVIVPNTVESYEVTKISEYAFENCNNLTNIKIDANVVEIGFGTFKNCSNLSKITLPFVGESIDSLNSHFGYIFGANNVNANAMFVPSSLKEVELLNEISIDEKAFYNCYSISEIILPNTIQNIGFGAFLECDALETMTLPFIGQSEQSNNTNFGYIFGADNFELNATFVPLSLREVIITNSTKIDDNSFRYCKTLTTISLPNTIGIIGSYSFDGCTNLSSITIPSAVTTINEYTFNNCYSLNEVVINGSITEIKEYAFANSNLSKISLPNSVNNIGDYSFYNTKITTINLNSNMEYIGESAFENCTNLSSVVLPNITQLNENTFASCSSLSNITIPNSVVAIKEGAFANCTKFTNITIPNTVKEISLGAFDGCSKVVKVTIPFIGESEESSNKHFGYIFGSTTPTANKNYVPNTLTEVYVTSTKNVGINAFFGCDSLIKVELPSSVETIENGIFVDCTNLQTITVPFLGESLNSSNSYIGYFFDTYAPNLNNSVVGSLKTVIILDGSTSIIENAFKDCTSITSITIPSTVVTIGNYAFYNTSITTINLNNAITSIGESAFENCTSLKNITLPNLTILKKNMFASCTSLNNITIPSTVTMIEDGVFSECQSFTNITIPNSVTVIGKGILEGAVKLNSLSIPFMGETLNTSNSYLGYFFDSSNDKVNTKVVSSLKTIILTAEITSIKDNAFKDCESITSITIPSTVVTIGNYAFYNINISTINLNSEITSIGESAFENSSLKTIVLPNITILKNNTFASCDLLTNVTLPDSLIEIEENAFLNCTSLTSLSIPNTVTTISNKILVGCTKLNTLTIPFLGETINTSNAYLGYLFEDDNTNTSVVSSLKTVILLEGITSIKAEAFKDCTSLTNITIPSTVETIGESAFENCTNLTTILLTNTITSIGTNAFIGCDNLVINCEVEEIPTTWLGFEYDDINECYIYTNNSNIVVNIII